MDTRLLVVVFLSGVSLGAGLGMALARNMWGKMERELDAVRVEHATSFALTVRDALEKEGISTRFYLMVGGEGNVSFTKAENENGQTH